MKLVIDTDSGSIEIRQGDASHVTEAHSVEGFALLTRLWLRAGWSLRYSYGFSWLGRPVIQLPEDLVRLQELLYRIRPDVVIVRTLEGELEMHLPEGEGAHVQLNPRYTRLWVEMKENPGAYDEAERRSWERLLTQFAEKAPDVAKSVARASRKVAARAPSVARTVRDKAPAALKGVAARAPAVAKGVQKVSRTVAGRAPGVGRKVAQLGRGAAKRAGARSGAKTTPKKSTKNPAKSTKSAAKRTKSAAKSSRTSAKRS